jgi:hypothetical protein
MGNRPQGLMRKTGEKDLKVKLAPHRKHCISPFKKLLMSFRKKYCLFWSHKEPKPVGKLHSDVMLKYVVPIVAAGL